MNTVVNEPRIKTIRVTKDEIVAQLMDGRVISVPLAWSWRLADATPEQRANFRLIGAGHGVHWPDVDEDISAEGMLFGTPARRPTKKFAPAIAPTPRHSRRLKRVRSSPTRVQ